MVLFYKILRWKFHVDESTTGRYDMILGRDLLTALVLHIKFAENVMHVVEVPYKACSSPMFEVNNYNFNILTGETVEPG